MTTVRVPDMMCEACEKNIRGALDKVQGVESVDVDLAAKQVTVKGNVEPEQVKAAIAEAGYTPE